MTAPTALPDQVAAEIIELAKSRGYDLQSFTLCWKASGLGYPARQSVTYEAPKFHTAKL